MSELRVTVLGCGLIGSSFSLALKRRRPDCRITCLDTPKALPAIKEARVADKVGRLDELDKYLPKSSLVVLAGPVETILENLDAIVPHLQPGTLVTDVGSTKTDIVNKAWEVLPEEVYFIGGHPIAGSESSGVENADPLMFNKRVWLLCPSPNTPTDALLNLIEIIEDMLAIPVTMEPEEHDRLMATLSHLPQLLSIALMHSALEVDQTHGMMEMVAGRGFLDITRIAASDYRVWESILSTNKKAIGAAFDLLEQSLSSVRTALENGEIDQLWSQVSGRRKMMSTESLPRHRKPELRKLIDRFDEQILKALGNRMRVVKKIGEVKAVKDAPVLDPDRERRLMAKRIKWAQSCDLSQEFVESLFSTIMQYSKKLQSQQAKEDKSES